MKNNMHHFIQSTINEPGLVKAWEETISIPTYEVGDEEKNPMFLEKRVYQGSSGVVYPYPIIEKIFDVKTEKSYQVVFLENQYIKIMILPEFGGRLQMGFDKMKQRHFVYYNQVIKPALIGLNGPWISGGIEFNWPQHHRPSTFLPVEYMIENNRDGSVTVWCNEVERMSRTKGMHGFTLYPDKAYLEVKVKIYNRTPLPQTFLWWANPAVKVNDSYKSVFPPDVHIVFDHGKRDVSTYPIARGIYYKQDYSSGIDISKYKNIPVPTSYMAAKSEYDFLGGYEEDSKGGLLHVANHHISPGKKQWTWGNGNFGQAWDRNLTDEDGPYIELMTGVYTDNQPDFSWLQPYEEKSWSQFFIPYSQVGSVKNATKDILSNLTVVENKANINLYSTSEFENLEIILKDKQERLILHDIINIRPEKPYNKSVDEVNVPDQDLILIVKDCKHKTLLIYKPEKNNNQDTPQPAKAAKLPHEIDKMEELYLTGQHLEQYRHATYNPMDYYNEALQRDQYDVRCNNAKGLLLLRRGKYVEAQRYFEAALMRLTEKNPNPYDSEPYYNLGYARKLDSKYDLAYDDFFKATWNAAWQDPAFFSLSQIDCIREDWETALDNVNKSLIRNQSNHKARHLKAVILRKLQRSDEAMDWINASLEIDNFNIGCIWESHFITGNDIYLRKIENLLKNKIETYIEYSLDYLNAGLLRESAQVLNQCIKYKKDKVYPMTYYILGYIAHLQNNKELSLDYYHKAENASPDKCFPNRIEEAIILQHAFSSHLAGSKAYYYLGNYWYANKQHNEAVECWEASIKINSTFPTVFRNLSLAYFNKKNRKEDAKAMLEYAFSLDESDARILYELDQLYKKLNKSHSERLAFLEQHHTLVEQRDDLIIERITLYNHLKDFNKARQLISAYTFHPWEGGEGKITSQYLLCRIELAKIAIIDGRYHDALLLLKETEEYPHNLGEGKLENAEENDIEFFKAIAYRGMGDEVNATKWFRKATTGADEPAQKIFYNDQNPVMIYYQGLAWRELGYEYKSKERFKKLIEHGKEHINDDIKLDYFAVSLPDMAIWEDNLNILNRVHCYSVMALGYLGYGEKEKAADLIKKVLEHDINNQNYMHFNLDGRPL